VSAAAFVYLTDRSAAAEYRPSHLARSEVWRTKKPLYVTKGEPGEGLDKVQGRRHSVMPDFLKKRSG
jgi:hypothetical protein